MKYIVIRNSNKDKFEEMVTSYISMGFLPQGGVSVTIDKSDTLVFYQAMVKKLSWFYLARKLNYYQYVQNQKDNQTKYHNNHIMGNVMLIPSCWDYV